MDASPIDPAGCRWIWRDDEWRLMQGPDRLLAVIRREAAGWAAYNAAGRFIAGWTGDGAHASDARAHVERMLGIGHVMVSEYTIGG